MRTKSPSITLEGLIEPINNLYEVVKDFVEENQGEKGYINTNVYDDESEENGSWGNDIIYGAAYCDEHEMGEERIVFGVRVKDGVLQVLMLPNWDTPTNETYENNENWDNVKDGFSCYFYPTIINLAESIEQYV